MLQASKPRRTVFSSCALAVDGTIREIGPGRILFVAVACHASHRRWLSTTTGCKCQRRRRHFLTALHVFSKVHGITRARTSPPPILGLYGKTAVWTWCAYKCAHARASIPSLSVHEPWWAFFPFFVHVTLGISKFAGW